MDAFTKIDFTYDDAVASIKVAALGEDVRRAAEKKFQEINDAKDRIYKARGL